jgi:hypothetical protein
MRRGARNPEEVEELICQSGVFADADEVCGGAFAVEESILTCTLLDYMLIGQQIPMVKGYKL